MTAFGSIVEQVWDTDWQMVYHFCVRAERTVVLCARIKVHQIPVWSHDPMFNPTMDVTCPLVNGWFVQGPTAPWGWSVAKKCGPPWHLYPRQGTYVSNLQADRLSSPETGRLPTLLYLETAGCPPHLASVPSRRDGQGRKDIFISIVPLVGWSMVHSKHSEDF